MGSCALPTDFAPQLIIVGRIANLVRTREARCPGARLQHTDTDLPRTTLPISPVAPCVNMHTICIRQSNISRIFTVNQCLNATVTCM